ncbi:MAG: Gfo/Idh/MocA family oxidoreductase, partial [Verrucomicrobia bacterium]|nr:Gfo/Idh/MocA family oxidoreductase [Verrucomicrobiota bacterium]
MMVSTWMDMAALSRRIFSQSDCAHKAAGAETGVPVFETDRYGHTADIAVGWPAMKAFWTSRVQRENVRGQPRNRFVQQPNQRSHSMNTQINRRDFLRSSAAAVAAVGLPHFVPATAFGANNKIALGCIGVGGMGTGNMKNFLALEDCRVVAVCDTYKDKQEKAKKLVDGQYGDPGCAMFGDYRKLLARKDIDAVMAAPQDHWHALIATAAAKAGKDMYLEKPMGVSIEEGQKILAAVRKHKRVFQAGTWQRSKPTFLHACELARNGYVGKIHAVQVSAPGPQYQPKYKGPFEPQPVPEGFDWEMWRGPAPNKPYNPGRVAWPDWYLIWDYCVGFICNWGVHHLDIANWGCPAIVGETF